MAFAGFPRGTQYTPVPDPLFGLLLEAIDDPAELKCTLRVMGLLHQSQKRRQPRCVTSSDLLSDRTLLIGLKSLDVSPAEAIRQGMIKGVGRGTFLSVSVSRDGEEEEVYFLNDEAGQRAAENMAKEGPGALAGATRERVTGEPPGARANIFVLYEENIGMLTPLLAEEMKEAEQNYPWPWIAEAFKLAVTRNKRSWRYIETTLRRWATEGKGDGELGGHTEKVSIEEYRRRQGLLRKPG